MEALQSMNTNYNRKSGQAHRRRSGQAIIFLMVVVVIGLFVVIWNFDLHRIITAKIRVRNAADAAAMAGARWQGVTLNMIGDLNLIQAAILAIEAEEQEGLPEFLVPASVPELHDLRKRLAFFGPLAAFSIAQQAAFDNGAFHDPKLQADLLVLADEIREQVNAPPFDNAYDDYAELLERIVTNGVAAGSYPAIFPNHPLTQERFYSGVAQALAGLWCGLERYRYELEEYEDFESWGKLNTDYRIFYMLSLKMAEFRSRVEGEEADGTYRWPRIAIATNRLELFEYFETDERGTFANQGADTDYSIAGMYPNEPDADISWHIYSGAWERTWPRPRNGEDDLEEEENRDVARFPIWGAIQDRYNYMGAEAGFSMAMPVHRGILSSSARATVDLTYKTKAKPFGYILAPDGTDYPPYYFGLVFPVFTDVRLVHSDIGDRQLPADFFRHVNGHLAAYLNGGPEALNPQCRYCRLLEAWEGLDRAEGLRWLDEAEEKEDNPCDPSNDGSEFDGLSGGATRGS